MQICSDFCCHHHASDACFCCVLHHSMTSVAIRRRFPREMEVSWARSFATEGAGASVCALRSRVVWRKRDLFPAGSMPAEVVYCAVATASVTPRYEAEEHAARSSGAATASRHSWLQCGFSFLRPCRRPTDVRCSVLALMSADRVVTGSAGVRANPRTTRAQLRISPSTGPGISTIRSAMLAEAA